MHPHRIIDAHVHFSAPRRYGDFLRFLTEIGIEGAGIVSLPDRLNVNFNPEALAAKLNAPDRFYVFGGFDYSRWLVPGIERSAPLPAAQVERMAELGMDGIKMWAGKPTFQAELGFGLDDAIYGPAFDAAGLHRMPIVIHVADPPQFWSSDQPRFGWRGADRGGTLPGFDRLQRQAVTILRRHRNTLFIFPHLLFRTGDLDAFSRFMNENENAYLDLSPGLYFYADLHRQRPRALRFFEEFKERVLFGTDAMWFEEGHPYLPALDVEENVTGARRLLDFLMTGNSIENPFALTRDEVPVLDGLELPAPVLDPILGGNFLRLVGDRPRAVDEGAVRSYIAEVEFLRTEISERGGER